MRFHVVSLPHTQVSSAYASCAYTEKVRKFCRMMHERGHTVILYAGEQNEAPCTEHVVCISEAERLAACGGGHFTSAPFNPSLPHWKKFNGRVIAELKDRLDKTDFICVIAGIAHKPICEAYPNHLNVEFGIGYGGTFANYRVWESYAWMHHCYGYDLAKAGRGAHDADGKWFDAVIPGYLEPESFPVVTKKQPYLLYVGRMIERKGIAVAVQVAKACGYPLIMAGPGTPPKDNVVDYVGEVGPAERADLMGNARALLAPTVYLEPFGNVVVEAQACGTPTITTDWGAFTETNVNGLTGFRCHVLQEFVNAVEAVERLDPVKIATRARALYSLDAIGAQYQRYFERLSLLWKAGWPELQ
jgi:glycosyltransferase involved in cell wall biosynthesis